MCFSRVGLLLEETGLVVFLEALLAAPAGLMMARRAVLLDYDSLSEL